VNAPNVDDLLRQGIEDVRNGNRAAARDKLQKVVDLDENNEKAWLWLASVVDTDEEKRVCLGNVLHINPANDRARKALDALEEKKKQQASQDEVIPGVSRRQLYLIGGAGVVIVVLLLIILLGAIGANTAAVANATQQAVNAQATGTSIVLNATETSVAGTATQLAIATPTLEPTATSARPTLEPEWTATSLPTQAATAASLPPPTGLTGILSVWGGRDLENSGFLPLGYFNFDSGNTYTRIGDDIGRDIRIGPSGQRVVYTRYDRLLFGTTIDAVNLNGQQIESLADRWRGQGTILNPQMPDFSPDGTFVVFIATDSVGHDQVYRLSLVDNSLVNLTNDTSDYAFPDISPDGQQIVVVRTDTQGGTGTDLAIVSASSGGKFAVTSDQNAYVETHPRWTADGSQIVYAAAPQTEPNNYDIVVRAANSTAAPSLLIRNPANDQYPVLSRSGRYLAFGSDRSGNWEIYVYDVQAQALFQLTNDPDDNFPGDWWQLSG